MVQKMQRLYATRPNLDHVLHTLDSYVTGKEITEEAWQVRTVYRCPKFYVEHSTLQPAFGVPVGSMAADAANGVAEVVSRLKVGYDAT